LVEKGCLKSQKTVPEKSLHKAAGVDKTRLKRALAMAVTFIL
jgi:hypothetical protein